MLRLIIAVALSLAVAYFALQNTGGVSITIATTTIAHVPLYLVVVCSVLIGLVIGWIVHLMNMVSLTLSLHQKDKNLKEAQKENVDLTKRIHELELAHAKITGEDTADESSL